MPTSNNKTNKLSGSSILNSKGINEKEQTALIDAYGKVLAEGGIQSVIKEDENSADPYGKYFDSLNTSLDYEVPKVSINGNKISISAPESFYDTPMAAQLDTELKVLKGSSLSNPEVVKSIESLNEELRRAYSTAAIEQALGWTEQEYNDYKLALQTASYANPMNYSTGIWGLDKEGKKQKKTFKNWVKYYREAYDTKERGDALLQSIKSKNPYERIMAVILMGGKTNGNSAVYGFDPWEQSGQGLKAAWNQIKKLPEGTFRFLVEGNDAKRVEGIVNNKKISAEAMRNFKINSEEKFNEMKEKIAGKSWSQLSEEEKAFIVLLGASREEELERNADTTEEMKDYKGSAYDAYPWMSSVSQQDRKREEQKAAGRIARKDLNEAISDDKEASKAAIDRILSSGSSFDKYKKLRDDYDTWQGYEEESNKDDEELAKTVIWSRVSQGAGNIAGTIARFLWENAIVQGLTGGLVNMSGVSDVLGKGIINSLVKHHIVPASAEGSAILKFVTSLVGTIPEDVIQTSVDNILTYNAEENKNWFNPEEMSNSFANNFVTMAIFNAAKSGMNAFKRARMAKKLAKIQEFATKVDVSQLEGLLDDVDNIKRTTDNGGDLKVEDEKVTLVDAEGNETQLTHIKPEQAEMIQMKLFDDGEVDGGSVKTQDGGVEIDGDDAARVVDNAKAEVEEETTTVKVDTPDGEENVTVRVYRPKGLLDGIKAKVNATIGELTHWHSETTKVAMRELKDHLTEFHNKFGDVTPDDFDWVRYNIETLKKPVSEIIGTTDPTTGRKITKKKIKAMEWWAEQPFVKELRLASREGIGLEGDYNTLGYLPRSDYDPSTKTFEDAKPGALWQESTGAAVLDDEGNYKGYGGTFEDRYRTYVSNMLWDSKAKEIAATKLIEEARMEGADLSADEAIKMVDGQQELDTKVADAESTKSQEKYMTSTSEGDSESGMKRKEFQEARKKAESDAAKVGAGKAIHDNYGPITPFANQGAVTKQSGAFRQTFDTLGNTMRNTEITYTSHGKEYKLNLYDSGGAELIYAPRSGLEMATRFKRLQADGAKPDLREMYIDYEMTQYGRPRKYAEFLADKAMARVALDARGGEITVASMAHSLSKSMRSEAWSRIRKFLSIAKYDTFNKSTKKMIDGLLFGHMQTNAIVNSSKISNGLAKVLDTIVDFRYKSLFYGNIKNALLQTTELNRYFTSFKWGDVAKMTKRLATDADFRARVGDMVNAVAPMSKELKADLFAAYNDVAGSMKTGEDGGTLFTKIKDAAGVADKIGMAPVESAESFKNWMMVAALVEEADRKGLTGTAALRHVRERFERVGLAVDEINRLGFTSNPLARTMFFLQNFQIKELGMHLYNLSDAYHIKDATGMDAAVPKKVLGAAKYLTKVLGSKMATTLIMARLGYSANQTLGIDPFGLLDNYNDLDEEDMEWPDYFFKSPLFAGGVTSMLSDLYFMARKAYEESTPRAISEEAREEINGESSYGIDWIPFDELMGLGAGFLPGYTAINRASQMTDTMNRGWAVSKTGNRMYTAPTGALDTALGYAFGRSATANAQQYNQTYGDNLAQTIGRFNPLRDYNEFDPIDTKNYTDWFKGNENDRQQFNKGITYFREEKERIIDEYNKKVKKKKVVGDSVIDEAVNAMNADLETLFDKMERFVDAYEKKNGSITSAMAKQIVNILNTSQDDTGGTSSGRSQEGTQGYFDALRRYSDRGFPAVGLYSGAYELAEGTDEEKAAAWDKKSAYKGSPQWQTYTNATTNLKKEMAAVLKKADERLQQVRNDLKQDYYAAINNGNWDAVKAIQYEYLNSFDKVVAPIVALYGNSALDSPEVKAQLQEMLSLSSKKKADLIPSEHYTKNKYGRYTSVTNQSVDVGEWAQQRYRSSLYSQPTARSYTTVSEDIAEIKRLASNGQNDRARARALQLWARMDNQIRALSEEDYKWLINFINKK